MNATASWHELVTAALLGAQRRTPPGGDPAALLDAAAAQTVRRRAGLRPATAGRRPEPAPADPRPPLPPAARDRLATLLAERSGSGPGQGGHHSGAPDLGELLPQWLALANQHGYRAPAHQLPALLDAARARTDLRAEALALAGPRGVWLARRNPAWRFALRGAVGAGVATGPAAVERRPGGTPAEATDGGDVADGDAAADARAQRRTRELWEEGLFAERAALLLTERRRRPAAARALLERTWATERAEDRLAFLDVLREGLSEDDEPFLERALTDRGRTIQATAAELLSALPRSAFAARMAERARACLVLEGAPDRRRIAVYPPTECDAAMRRDGVPAKPASGRGGRSAWLGHILEAAPLSVWRDHLGGGTATPQELVALPVAADWRAEVHAGWCRAAVRQGDAAWARALLGDPNAPTTADTGDPVRLLTVLPGVERARWVARFVATHGLAEAFRMLAVCEVPWSAELGRSVVDALEIARDAGSYTWSYSGVLGLAERCLDPREAERLAPLTAKGPGAPEGSPGVGGYWAEAFGRLVDTLRLRDVMRRELAGDAEATTP